jgi:hypothetical protein
LMYRTTPGQEHYRSVSVNTVVVRAP